MKVIVVQADGLGDEASADLGGKTPLEVARTPNLDAMASKGILGLARMIPDGMPPAAEVGALAVLGYDPARHRSGSAVFDAAGVGLALEPGDVAFRLSLVVTALAEDGTEVVRDALGGALDAAEQAEVVRAIAGALAAADVVVRPDVGGHAVVVWRNGDARVRTLPPYSVLGKPVSAALPIGPGADRVRDLMRRAADVLAAHPVCEAHRAANEPAPTAAWLWAHGTALTLPPFTGRWPVRAAAVPGGGLARGLATLAGLDIVESANGAGGFAAAAQAALVALDTHDVVFVGVHDADEASHRGDAAAKVGVIERLDEQLVGPLLEALGARGDDWRMMVVSDHVASCTSRGHTTDAVPFVVSVAADRDKTRGLKRAYHERDARELGIFIPEGHRLLERLLRE